MFALKLVLSALVIACASELGKRSTSAGAILISLPLSSLLAITWLYVETKDTARVAGMTSGIFWAILPSLLFFLVLPVLLKKGWAYWPALGVSCVVTTAGYAAYAAARTPRPHRGQRRLRRVQGPRGPLERRPRRLSHHGRFHRRFRRSA
jgi:hypothetical protein